MTLLTITEVYPHEDDQYSWVITAELLHDGETYEVAYDMVAAYDEDHQPYGQYTLNVSLNGVKQYASWGHPAETHLAKTLSQNWIVTTIEDAINRIKAARIIAESNTITLIKSESFKFHEEEQ